MGWYHLECLATAAKTSELTWRMYQNCSTCNQGWSGQVCRGMAEAAHANFAGPVETEMQVQAGLMLSQAMFSDGDFVEASECCAEALNVSMRVHGDAQAADETQIHPDTIEAMAIAGIIHSMIHSFDIALQMQYGVLNTCRRVNGNEDEATMRAMENLGTTHGRMENHHLALPLLQEASDISRRVRGDECLPTLSAMGNLGSSLHAMGDTAAIPLREKVVAISRRLLGNRHPATLTHVANLAITRSESGDHSNAFPLFDEAITGMVAVLGAENYVTQHAVRANDSNNRCLVDPAFASDCQHVRQQQLHKRQQQQVVHRADAKGLD